VSVRPRDRGERSTGVRRGDGSFRDPASGVVLVGPRVLRHFDDDAARTFSALAAAGVLDDLARRGAIIGWQDASPADAREVAAVAPCAALVLEHPRVPFVSYPYEWPFAMLKAAALLTLEIQAVALHAGFTLKDASPYNVQFVGARPVFIDLGSFERHRDGAPWAAYTQFCRLFLYPLLLDALRGVPYHGLLRSSLDGLDAARLSRLLHTRDKLRPSVFRDVVLQGWLERWSGTLTAGETVAAGRVERRALFRLIERLRDAVGRLGPGVAATHWSEYDDTAEYTAEARELKARAVEATVSARPRSLVWDLGCNTGRFSTIAARRADYLVAFDADAAVVNTLALGGHPNLLPLVVDVLNPSPDQGWAGTERLGLAQRGRPDLALCLGLLHHLVIQGQVPLHDVVGWLASLAAEIVVEFVPEDDPGFRKLVRWRSGDHHAYSAEALEAALGERFGSVTRTALAPSGRALYRATRT
jgi:ribosomal protein L11 methylase PrmA